jgi:hypothetical protein
MGIEGEKVRQHLRSFHPLTWPVDHSVPFFIFLARSIDHSVPFSIFPLLSIPRNG